MFSLSMKPSAVVGCWKPAEQPARVSTATSHLSRDAHSSVLTAVPAVPAVAAVVLFHARVPPRPRHRGNLCAAGAKDTDLETSSASASAALATRQEVEERLVTMREKMEAIRRKEPNLIRSDGLHKGSELHGVVLWCDSDPNILSQCDVLRGSGLEVQHFQSPEALLQQYLRAPKNVLCIMSSMMEGNGRKDQPASARAMNAYDLLDLLPRAAEAKRCPKPLLVIISCSADEAKAKAAGADLVVMGNRIKAQNLIVTKLRKSMGLQAGYVGDTS